MAKYLAILVHHDFLKCNRPEVFFMVFANSIQSL